jgi:hypothetical protein
MYLSERFSRYTRLSDEAKMKFPIGVISYVNVTLCVYGVVVAGYMSTSTTFNELIFLQYWLLMSLFMTGLLNVTLIWHRSKNEAHEIVYELKMIHAMFFGNALIHYLINTSQSAVSNVLINNLVHCCALALMLVELTVLLGHSLDIYSNYHYAKACFLIVMFVAAAAAILVMGATSLKNMLLCDNLLMAALLSSTYLLMAIVWAVRKKTAVFNLQRDQIMAFNKPPPTFATVEMENMLKNKV